MYRLAGTAGIERAFDNVADGHQAADYTRVSSVAAPEFVPLLTCSMAHMLYKSSGAGEQNHLGCGTAARRPRPGFSHLPVGGLNAPPSRVLQQHQYPAMRPTHQQVGDKNGVVVVILRIFLPVAVGPCGRSLPVHSPVVPNCPLPAPLFRCRAVRTQVPVPEWGHPPASGSRDIRRPAKIYHASHKGSIAKMGSCPPPAGAGQASRPNTAGGRGEVYGLEPRSGTCRILVLAGQRLSLRTDPVLAAGERIAAGRQDVRFGQTAACASGGARLSGPKNAHSGNICRRQGLGADPISAIEPPQAGL